VFEGVEGEEADSGFEGVASDEGRAANIVLFAEGWERLLQGIGKGAVQLEAGLREFSGVLVGQSIAEKVVTVTAASIPPAMPPAIIDRNGLGFYAVSVIYGKAWF
jgi:hypothetical protein